MLAVLGFSFNAIAPLLCTVALGYLMGRRKDLKEAEIEVLNKLCFRYLLSLHIFNSTRSIDYEGEFNLKLLLFAAVSIVLIVLFAWIIFTLTIRSPGRRCIFIVSAFRSNNVIYALPLAENLFGESGARVAAMLVPVTIILFNFFTVIAMVYHSRFTGAGSEDPLPLRGALKRTAVDIAKNPLILGSVLGILLSVCRLDLPAFLAQGLRSLALTATPVSLLLLGAQIDLKQLSRNLGPALGVCIVRLVLVPGLLLPLMLLLGFRGQELGVLVVAFGAPCAVANLVMARNYQLDPPFAAQTVYLTTVLSMFTMFGIISILRGLSLL
ncbi:MAG: AEC family transporter [Spirochaetaceae bacterium]|nr:AEC family transporter [Spirochaetaceae bacterium]